MHWPPGDKEVGDRGGGKLVIGFCCPPIDERGCFRLHKVLTNL